METNAVKKFLIDGFPRNKDNLEGWEKEMSGKANVKCVLFFDCSEQACLDRAMKRGESSGRSDDNLESFKKRYHTYTSQTMPIIEHYEKKGLVKRIDAAPHPDTVFQQVAAIVKDF
jgi:UMP-CMP kinase